MKPKKVSSRVNLIAVILFGSITGTCWARFTADVETGLVFSGYNDVRIPGDTGTLFSLSQELETERSVFFRLKLGYVIARRHSVTLLIAPLRLSGEGRVNRDILFEDRDFPANTPLESTYRFDSYRIGYRYHFFESRPLEFGAGVTLKLRDASIKLAADNQTAEKKNTGFVPLINFMATWKPTQHFSLLLDGDALAAPQGRAEDVLLALRYSPSSRVGLKLGYRILEGGADVDEVYSFALVNYLVVGGTLYL
jgi:hypothetical protein